MTGKRGGSEGGENRDVVSLRRNLLYLGAGKSAPEAGGRANAGLSSERRSKEKKVPVISTILLRIRAALSGKEREPGGKGNNLVHRVRR